MDSGQNNSKDNDGLKYFYELLSKFWSPIVTFIGAITVLYGMVKTWRGDQETITWIAMGLGAFFLVFSLLHLSFGKKTIEEDYKITPFISRKRKVKVPRYSKKVSTISQMALGFVILGGIFSGFQYQKHRESIQDKFIIAVCEYDGPDRESYQISNILIKNLKASLADYENVEIIFIPEIIHEGNEEQLDIISKNKYADIIIWGWYAATKTDASITTNVEIYLDIYEDPVSNLRSIHAYSGEIAQRFRSMPHSKERKKTG